MIGGSIFTKFNKLVKNFKNPSGSIDPTLLSLSLLLHLVLPYSYIKNYLSGFLVLNLIYDRGSGRHTIIYYTIIYYKTVAFALKI